MHLAYQLPSSAKTEGFFTAVAFGAIKTRLTQAPSGEFVVRPDGTKHAVGFHGGYDEEEKWSVCFIPQILSAKPYTYIHRVGDIPLRRIGTPTDAGRAILAMVSPLFSYVTGQVSQAIICSEKILTAGFSDNHGKANSGGS